MDGEAQVKTLGQIAFDAYQSLDPVDLYKWESCSKWWQGVWESTAQAVRAAVIEECINAAHDVYEKWSDPRANILEALEALKGKQ